MPSFLPISNQQRRPRLVCEVRSGSVTTARADEATGLLAQVSHATLPEGAMTPSLHVGNIADRETVVSALRRTLGAVHLRSRDVTLIVPDASVRVLLLDFDTLPSKTADAIAVVRFRLTKLLSFDPETAAVSYQVLSQGSGIMQVLAVAMPRAVLAEYESAVRDAGYEPGSVLPSTLALAGALHATEPVLVINAANRSITTAIFRRGDVLLHRTLDLHPAPPQGEILPPALAAPSAEETTLALTVADDTDFVASEIQQAMTVAAAYFEDSFGMPPRQVFVAGEDHAAAVQLAMQLDLEPQEIVTSTDILATATTSVARSLLAGLRGVTTL
jgi:type IV pilus assembly protein PilM